ncbi:hypothetical protein ACIBQ0_10195 [Nocardia nova]|uniref:hypothetical protein n=1 Tax=Nocardia nova TaxID=37330 RepID=UPI0037A759F9
MLEVFTPRHGDIRSRSVDHDAVLRDLSEPGCPVCRAGEAADRNWHSWYVIETHSDPDYRHRVARAGGFCAAHLRWLCLDTRAQPHLTQAFADVIDLVLAQPSDAPEPTAPCPACVSRRDAQTQRMRKILELWADSTVRQALASSDCCVPHQLALLHDAPAAAADEVAQMTIRTLTEPSAGLLSVLIPLDADLARSAPMIVHANRIRRSDDKEVTGRSGLDRAVADLDRGCCPVCRSASQAQLRYLCWLLEQSLRELDTTELWLCPRHLGMATVFGYASAQQLADTMSGHTLARLRRLHDRLAETIRNGQLHTRIAHSVHSLRAGSGVAEVVRPLGSRVAECRGHFEHDATPCAVCTAAAIAERREIALLRASADEPAVRRQWEQGHGPCLSHARQCDDDRALLVLRSRLRLLAWELDETLRKRGWTARNEPVTVVEQAWRRAVPLLNGAAYFGMTSDEWEQAVPS